MIKLINLTKIYKGIKAVDDLNIEVERGKVFGFLGPNGAGKTTTIKMMAGVLKPTYGSIIINGKDIAKYPSEVKLSTGFIPDRPFLYEKLTGLEFLKFIAGLYRTDRYPSNHYNIMELLEIFELDHWCDEMIESYSHGMKQRLVMCSALLHKPKVLIVDEPMVGLDPKGARLVKDVFREQGANGTTVFMSTHSLEVAEDLCQEVAIIQAGKILAKGSPKEIQKEAGIDGDLENIFLKLTDGRRIASERSLSTS